MPSNNDKNNSIKNKLYPFNKETADLLKNHETNNLKNGNFGLRFNKFMPIDESYKLDKDEYEDSVKNFAIEKELLEKLLNEKHIQQYHFCKSYEKKYEVIVLCSELITPLITGIGISHPHEIGMLFDHTIGIPYIQASSIKGIVRFAHNLNILNLIQENPENYPNEIKKDKESKEYFDDEENWTKIPDMFGKGGDNGKIGEVIFLDAYPEEIPELHIDVMTPHYGDYYSNGKPPADYLQPNPIKFLTVAKGNKFIFRALIKKDKSVKLRKCVETALKKALTEQGIGAKTVVGYGLFKIIDWAESKLISGLIKKGEEEEKNKKIIKMEESQRIKKLEEREKMSEVDRICSALLDSNDEAKASELYKNIDSYNDGDKVKIAEALSEFYIKLKKWDKKDNPSKKQEEKNKKIKSILK